MKRIYTPIRLPEELKKELLQESNGNLSELIIRRIEAGKKWDHLLVRMTIEERKLFNRILRRKTPFI